MMENLDRLVADQTEPGAEEEYRALVRSLRRKQGFGLFFVQASPMKSSEILLDLRRDFQGKSILDPPLKRVVEITIKRDDEQLFETLERMLEIEEEQKKNKIDIFWIKGLEQSLFKYEDVNRFAGWDEKDLKTYSWKGVPPILSHLNLGRERFESRFKCVLVFVVPKFVVRYLLRRGVDFFDWKSGFFEFDDNQKLSSEQGTNDRTYDKYLSLDAEERLEEILHIRDLMNSSEIAVEARVLLFIKLGMLFELGKDYRQAEISYSHASQLSTDFDTVLLNFKSGNSSKQKLNLSENLEKIRHIERLLATSEIDDDRRAELSSQMGDLFRATGEYEQADIYYSRAIQFNPYLRGAWAGKSDVLRNLGRYEESLRASLSRRFSQGDGLLPESKINLIEVVGILESYGHVINDYQTNLHYISDQQFLVFFPFFKYMNGDVSFRRLLKHWQHDRINYEFGEYCVKSMMYYGGGGLDVYLDTSEFIGLANRAIEAKTKNNFLIQGFNKISSEFLLDQVRQMCYYRTLGQFWSIMADIFLNLANRYHKGQITTIRDVICHVKDGLITAAACPIYYSVEIKGEIYDLVPRSIGLTFLCDMAIPYIEAVFFRSLPFMGLLSYNAQAQQLPGDPGDFIYGALFADPISSGSAGVPLSLLASDLVRYMPEYLMDYYRSFSRGGLDLSVKSIASFQKSMFCVTSALMLGLSPRSLDSTNLKDLMENRRYFEAWIDRLINSRSRLEEIQTS